MHVKVCLSVHVYARAPHQYLELHSHAVHIKVCVYVHVYARVIEKKTFAQQEDPSPPKKKERNYATSAVHRQVYGPIACVGYVFLWMWAQARTLCVVLNDVCCLSPCCYRHCCCRRRHHHHLRTDRPALGATVLRDVSDNSLCYKIQKVLVPAQCMSLVARVKTKNSQQLIVCVPKIYRLRCRGSDDWGSCGPVPLQKKVRRVDIMEVVVFEEYHCKLLYTDVSVKHDLPRPSIMWSTSRRFFFTSLCSRPLPPCSLSCLSLLYFQQSGGLCHHLHTSDLLA